jgi:hypothetical protein
VKPLSIGVAIAAAFALLAGIIEGNGGVLGLAADPARLGVGVGGLMLAFTTFRSAVRERARNGGVWPPRGGQPGVTLKQENMLVVPASFSPLH